jgi:hypothetical protein
VKGCVGWVHHAWAGRPDGPCLVVEMSRVEKLSRKGILMCLILFPGCLKNVYASLSEKSIPNARRCMFLSKMDRHRMCVRPLSALCLSGAPNGDTHLNKRSCQFFF